jgi:hypothetical protein
MTGLICLRYFFEPIICVPIVAGKTMNIADNSSGSLLETMEK